MLILKLIYTLPSNIVPYLQKEVVHSSKQQQLLEYKMFHEVPQEKMNSQFTVVCKHLVNEHSAQIECNSHSALSL
jgi:hypothetical protein